MSGQSVSWADLQRLRSARVGRHSPGMESPNEQDVVDVLNAAAAAGWNVVYGPGDAFSVLAGPGAEPQSVPNPAAKPTDPDDWALEFIVVPAAAGGPPGASGRPPLRIEFDWTEGAGVYAFFRARSLDSAQETADGVRADGWVCWASGSLIAWHIHDPCRHGWRVLDEPLPDPYPEDLSDGTWHHDPLAWATIAHAVGQEVAGGLSAAASAIQASPAATDAVDPPGLEELRALGTSHRMRESGRPHRYPRFPGSGWYGYPARLDDLDVLDGAAVAGWDLAIGPKDGTFTVLSGPGDANPTSECVPWREGDEFGARDTFRFILSYEPGAVSPFVVGLEVLEHCAAGGIIAYRSDTTDTPDASPATSCPFDGWVSVIGDEALVTSYCGDLGELRAASGGVGRTGRNLNGPRAMAMIGRAAVFLAFDRTPPDRLPQSGNGLPGSGHATTRLPAASGPTTSGAGLTLPILLEHWPEIVEVLSLNAATPKPLTLACRPVAVVGSLLTLAFPPGQKFLRDVAERRRGIFEDVVGGVLGMPVLIDFVVASDEVVTLPKDVDGAR